MIINIFFIIIVSISISFLTIKKINMKKTIFTFVILFLFGLSSFASNADLFKLDYNAVQEEFTDLNAIVDIIKANPETTYSSLAVTNAGLVESVNLLPDAAMPLASGENVMGIPPFWWGCVFGLVGVGIVYFLTDQDSGEAKKALWGCAVATIAGTVFYFVAWGALFAASGG